MTIHATGSLQRGAMFVLKGTVATPTPTSRFLPKQPTKAPTDLHPVTCASCGHD